MNLDSRTEDAVSWLLSSREPSVRLLTRRDVLGEPTDRIEEDVTRGGWVPALLADLGTGKQHPYDKWTGAYWRLISLAELGVPAAESRVQAALDRVLQWRRRAREYAVVIEGRARICASMDGNALALCCRLGRPEDEQVSSIVACLLDWQWLDGGWNCDRTPTASRSSFHESLAAAAGLHAYARTSGDRRAGAAAERAAELFLSHRIFRRLADGEVIKKAWLVPHYPPYWRYDILQALLVLSRMGYAADPRATDALDELERQRRLDGRWDVHGCWWKPDSRAVPPDVVDWGRSGPNEMITLNALRVLRAAERI
jgi:hypothetical protein